MKGKGGELSGDDYDFLYLKCADIMTQILILSFLIEENSVTMFCFPP